MRGVQSSLWVACLATLACGWGQNGLERLTEVYGGKDVTTCQAQQDTGNGGLSDDALAVAALPGMAGLWSVRITEHGTVAPVGEKWPITIQDYLLLRIPTSQDGGLFTYCDQTSDIVAHDPDDPTRDHPLRPVSHLSDAFYQAGISFYHDFGASAPVFPKTRVVSFWGVTGLKDPENSPLPDKGAPTIIDDDADGRPGVTIVVEKPIQGKRYIVRRVVWNFDEAESSSDGLWMRGHLTFSIEEKAIGATDPLLESDSDIEAEPKGNAYVMRQVPPDFSCAQLRAYKDWLFGE